MLFCSSVFAVRWPEGENKYSALFVIRQETRKRWKHIFFTIHAKEVPYYCKHCDFKTSKRGLAWKHTVAAHNAPAHEVLEHYMVGFFEDVESVVQPIRVDRRNTSQSSYRSSGGKISDRERTGVEVRRVVRSKVVQPTAESNNATRRRGDGDSNRGKERDESRRHVSSRNRDSGDSNRGKERDESRHQHSSRSRKRESSSRDKSTSGSSASEVKMTWIERKLIGRLLVR